MKLYARENIEGFEDRVGREVYVSKDRVRSVSVALYYLIKAVYLAGALVCLLEIPLVFIGCFLLVYVLENSLMFPVIHPLYHAMFIELKEEEMSPGQHYAYHHHYHDPKLFPKIWLDYRLQYLWNRENYLAATNFFLLYGIVAGTLLIACFSTVHALCFFTCLTMTSLFQGIAHEWYHCRNKKGFYSFPVYHGMNLLEKIGILSSKNHVKHHQHHLGNLDQVEQWVDCWSPFAEEVCKSLWRKALRLHRPGEKRMVIFFKRLASVVLTLRLSALVALFLVLSMSGGPA